MTSSPETGEGNRISPPLSIVGLLVRLRGRSALRKGTINIVGSGRTASPHRAENYIRETAFPNRYFFGLKRFHSAKAPRSTHSQGDGAHQRLQRWRRSPQWCRSKIMRRYFLRYVRDKHGTSNPTQFNVTPPQMSPVHLAHDMIRLTTVDTPSEAGAAACLSSDHSDLPIQEPCTPSKPKTAIFSLSSSSIKP